MAFSEDVSLGITSQTAAAAFVSGGMPWALTAIPP